MGGFFNATDLQARQVLDGITLKSVWGAKTMLTFFDFQPNAVIPPHKHPHEQITYVIEGAMEFTLGEETKTLTAGEGVVIPSNGEHKARVLDMPTKAIDAWHPIREDYKITEEETE